MNKTEKTTLSPIVRVVFAEYDVTTQRTSFWQAGDDKKFAVDFTVEEMECLKKLCDNYSEWSEVRIEKEKQLVAVWKIPASFAIRIEEEESSFSGVFYDYRMIDLALVFAAQDGVKAKGHGTVETDTWLIQQK